MPSERYWFPAKRYGWGWGPPVTWQGWVITVAWLAIVIGAIPVLDPRRRPILFVAFLLAMTLVMLGVCYAKGEPPRWRWGDSE